MEAKAGEAAAAEVGSAAKLVAKPSVEKKELEEEEEVEVEVSFGGFPH